MKDIFLPHLRKESQAEIDDAVLTVSKKGAGEIEWPLLRTPSFFFWIFILLIFSVLITRLLYLNIIQGSYYESVAAKNSVRSFSLSAPRGILYDHSGKALVENLPSLDAILLPTDLPTDEKQKEAVLAEARSLLSLDDATWNEIEERLKDNPDKAFPLKENLSQDETILLSSQAKKLPGIDLFKSARRHYIDSTFFADVLGYEGKIQKEELNLYPDSSLTDTVGKQGIEKSYDSILRGVHGEEQVEVDSMGHVKGGVGVIPPEPGSDLFLHLESDLQKKITQTLSDWLASHNLKSAAAVALDPRNGAVLSLVTLPTFDNNLFAGGISAGDYSKLTNDPDDPLFNRAISGAYPPGSTIKPLLATAALSEGVISPETQIESRGGLSIGKFFFGDWRVNGFTDMRRAIAVSSDVYFYTIGGGYGNIKGLGMERMKKYENLFGWGAQTGIDLPGEETGLIPDPAWKKERFGERWYVGDDYHAAIGQGFVTTTPIQIASAYAAITNGGTLYTPELLKEIRSPQGKVTENLPKIIREHVARPDILQIVREGMRQTVTEGTAQSLQDLPVAVAGKTGTAQFGGGSKTHGWFISFAPYENPTLVLLILVEGQNEEGYNAVPITKDILSWYFSRPE